MIFDQSGTLTKVKRHDCLPFGEELLAGTGGRTTAQGYATGDNVRQQYTSQERDVETGLNFFGARHYASTQGRCQSIVPLNIHLERQKYDDSGEAEREFSRSIYNSRGQLAEIRTSTSYTGPTVTNWNRGAIINNYSDGGNGSNTDAGARI